MQPIQRGPANGLGIAALVIAIFALLLTWSVIGGLVFGVTAVILGFLAQARSRRGEATNGGVAVSGIVLGAIAAHLVPGSAPLPDEYDGPMERWNDL